MKINYKKYTYNPQKIINLGIKCKITILRKKLNKKH